VKKINMEISPDGAVENNIFGGIYTFDINDFVKG
jgi:hypothetical protein